MKIEIEKTTIAKYTRKIPIGEDFVIPHNLLTAIGGDAMIFLRAMYHLLKNHGTSIAGDPNIWISNTIDAWHKQFRFWSKLEIKKILKILEDHSVIVSKKINNAQWDQTKWYTINKEVLSEMIPSIGVVLSTVNATNSKQKSNTTTIVKKMLGLWSKYIAHKEENCDDYDYKQHFLELALRKHFKSDLKQWEKFLFYITHSKYLMGMDASNFKISLEWLLVEENLITVKSGKFHSSSARSAYRSRKIKFNQQIKV